ncbi:3323_t:CDS:1 [Dentiscutata heterogama]|uniref:3323_t:CDS:1 n=1 Tax=Dentiscutata heterogama TaxID=1316150 RepID=A0ACA9KU30_9GLOM|nr:3323_t:CDS:1 [Dentiscutata heterogama]
MSSVNNDNDNKICELFDFSYEDNFDNSTTKGNIGELQAFIRLREIQGCFISRRPILPNGDGKIDLQGYQKDTYYIIQVKYHKKQICEVTDQVVEKKKIKEFEQFLDEVKHYPNAKAIFYDTSGVEIYKDIHENYDNGRIFVVDSIEDMIGLIESISKGKHKEKILCKRPQNKLTEKKDIGKYLKDLNEKYMELYAINYEFRFPFELKGNENEIGYSGIDFVGFYKVPKIKHPISIRDESSIKKVDDKNLNNDNLKLLKRYYREFFKAVSVYLHTGYLGIFIVDQSFYNDNSLNEYYFIDQEIIVCTKENILKNVRKYFDFDSEFRKRRRFSKRMINNLEKVNQELKHKIGTLKKQLKEK